MTTKELIETLKNYPEDMQIFVSNDPEGNTIKKIENAYIDNIQKSDGNGSYEAIIIFPTDEEVYIYDDEEEY